MRAVDSNIRLQLTQQGSQKYDESNEMLPKIKINNNNIWL